MPRMDYSGSDYVRSQTLSRHESPSIVTLMRFETVLTKLVIRPISDLLPVALELAIETCIIRFIAG